jgi:hypothetical protein
MPLLHRCRDTRPVHGGNGETLLTTRNAKSFRKERRRYPVPSDGSATLRQTGIIGVWTLSKNLETTATSTYIAWASTVKSPQFDVRFLTLDMIGWIRMVKWVITLSTDSDVAALKTLQ